MDLAWGVTVATVTHDHKIDWLELNETGRKLLLRDKRLKLYLYDIESQQLTTMLQYCSYVQVRICDASKVVCSFAYASASK